MSTTLASLFATAAFIHHGLYNLTADLASSLLELHSRIITNIGHNELIHLAALKGLMSCSTAAAVFLLPRQSS